MAGGRAARNAEAVRRARRAGLDPAAAGLGAAGAAAGVWARPHCGVARRAVRGVPQGQGRDRGRPRRSEIHPRGCSSEGLISRRLHL